jgi:hypothetical protein
MGITLPPLCGCHGLHPLDARYPRHCATNCRFHRDEAAYYEMLHSLLHAYGVTA